MFKRKSAKAAIALALAAVTLLGYLPVQAQAASSSEIKKQISSLKEEYAQGEAQLNELKAQYNANEDEIEDLVEQKDVIDQEITLLNGQIRNLNDQIASFALLIADKQDELDDAQNRLAELNHNNKERIRAMEEEGKLSYWEVLFKANSFSDLLDRLNMVQEINATDKRRIQEMSDVAEEVRNVQETLSVEKAEMELSRAELDAATLELEEKRGQADELLRKLIEKGEEFQILMDESEELQDELMQEIAQAEKDLKEAQYKEWLATYVPPTTRPAGGDTAPSTQIPSSGGWVSPLKSYTLTSPFGMRVHPIHKVPRMHNGVDMAAPSGTKIYAAKSGKVTTTAYQAGGAGNYVVINHGDGFSSVYMHMTNYIVSPGQYVDAGQVIGYVGSTGGSTGPHLHFGISYKGTYVNPMEYV